LVNTKLLLGAFVLAGVLLAAGAVAASLLASNPEDEEAASCP
jgi:hypothetical protein